MNTMIRKVIRFTLFLTITSNAFSNSKQYEYNIFFATSPATKNHQTSLVKYLPWIYLSSDNHWTSAFGNNRWTSLFMQWKLQIICNLYNIWFNSLFHGHLKICFSLNDFINIVCNTKMLLNKKSSLKFFLYLLICIKSISCIKSILLLIVTFSLMNVNHFRMKFSTS